MLSLRRRKHRSAVVGPGAPRQFERVFHGVLFQIRRAGNRRFVPGALVGEHILNWAGAFVQAAGERCFLLTFRGRGFLTRLLGHQEVCQHPHGDGTQRACTS